MGNVVFGTAVLLLASGLFAWLHTDRVFEELNIAEVPSHEDTLAGLNAAVGYAGPEERLRQVMFTYLVARDYEEALPELERLSDDSADAAHLLADAYMHGRGVEVDFDVAASWLERAAELGSEQAARDLAFYRARH